jgi:lysophospholipase L1-like esterase
VATSDRRQNRCIAPIRSCSMRVRYFDAAMIVASVVIIVGLGLAFRPERTATITADPSAVDVDRSQLVAADTRPSVLFIGDSYTAGNGLPEMSYGCMAAVRMGWLCNVSAAGGTGYISGGPAKRFIDRIPNLALVYQPDVVVLDGGRNDPTPPSEKVLRAMAGTIGEARRAWPNARIACIRPRFLAEPDNDLGFNDAFIAQLREQPLAAGVTFLDPIITFTGRDTSAMLADDRIHPNHRGELALTAALVESIRVQRFATSR